MLQKLLREWKRLAIAPGATVLATVLSWTGVVQPLEWAFFDNFVAVRPLEATDPRIVVVTIDDADISRIGQWPIPDVTLAKALRNLSEQQPRVIGLDIYRDLAVEPGHQQLVDVFRTVPNLVGIEKRFGLQKVPAPPVLAELNRVALADLVEDPDSTVRRGLLSAKDAQTPTILSLGTDVALRYLAEEGVQLEAGRTAVEYRLGLATFRALDRQDGGYIQADAAGYQILMNYRGPQEAFQTLSLTEVLSGEFAGEEVRDRIVLIGSTAESINDFFLTPYDGSAKSLHSRTPGVFIHANLASQIMSAALDGRPLLQVVPEPLEWLWTFGWVVLSVLVTREILEARRIGQRFAYTGAVLSIFLSGGALISVGYLLFLGSWWIPVVPALMGLTIAAIASIGAYNQQLQQFAYFDGLTQVANRRYFDQQLLEFVQVRGNLSLILCDVDCFKNYNDTYGHQAGDSCLKQVAHAIHSAVRRTDIVARYGGEEFAVILPNANAEAAAQVAERILKQVRKLDLVHATSTASDHVTLSCGVVTVMIDDATLSHAELLPVSLVARADKALYGSKQSGRDRLTIAP
ncbi:MAG: CHASE2 domain-containing protein [Oculatellaceae cyanobacterium Prado106]|nr:CHASE2 domain-containing protein [Oculatellaceae cyanobacterium Prado106]